MSIWNITEFNGYVPKTTFWNDFETVEPFGEGAIHSLCRAAMREWAHDKIYLTELSLVLNHRLWMHYERGNETLARIYDELWRNAHAYAVENLNGDDLRYYLEVTD